MPDEDETVIRCTSKLAPFQQPISLFYMYLFKIERPFRNIKININKTIYLRNINTKKIM